MRTQRESFARREKRREVEQKASGAQKNLHLCRVGAFENPQ
jgi:hypothetical protein